MWPDSYSVAKRKRVTHKGSAETKCSLYGIHRLYTSLTTETVQDQMKLQKQGMVFFSLMKEVFVNNDVS